MFDVSMADVGSEFLLVEATVVVVGDLMAIVAEMGLLGKDMDELSCASIDVRLS